MGYSCHTELGLSITSSFYQEACTSTQSSLFSEEGKEQEFGMRKKSYTGHLIFSIKIPYGEDKYLHLAIHHVIIKNLKSRLGDGGSCL